MNKKRYNIFNKHSNNEGTFNSLKEACEWGDLNYNSVRASMSRSKKESLSKSSLHIKSREMNQEELRVGNFVQDIEDKEVIKADIYTLLNHENYEPIPLTEEWLFNFGFEFRDLDIKKYPLLTYGFYYGYEDTGFNLHLDEDSEEIMQALNIEGWSDGIYFVFDNWAVWIRMNWVHQLQNLHFTLYSQELELKS